MNLFNPFSAETKTPGMYKATELLSGKKKAEEYRNSRLKGGSTAPAEVELSSTKEGRGGFDFTEAEQASLKEKEVFQEIYIAEAKALREFFGFHVNVPLIPKEITPEKLKAWEAMGFELHYLPKMTLDENADYPGWGKKPNHNFYNLIKDGELPASAIMLQAGWYLIDACQKPQYNEGCQMYDNDPFAKALEELNADGKITQKNYDGTKLDVKSRFGLHPDDFDKPEVKTELALALDIEPDQLSLPPLMVWNVIANIHHPEWGTTSSGEWTKEKTKSGERLFCGDSDFGGASDVGSDDRPFGGVGFRPLVVFKP